MSGPYGLRVAHQVMPALPPEEFAALKADIAEHGITVPVLLTPDDVVIDGHHRLRAADELGLDSDDIPWQVARVDTEGAARDLAYRINAKRRGHLTREQKRAALEESLRADPELPDRRHAERVGTSPTTAGAVRAELEARGDVSKLDTRQDSLGRTQPATKPPRQPAGAVGAVPGEGPPAIEVVSAGESVLTADEARARFARVKARLGPVLAEMDETVEILSTTGRPVEALLAVAEIHGYLTALVGEDAARPITGARLDGVRQRLGAGGRTS